MKRDNNFFIATTMIETKYLSIFINLLIIFC